MIALTVIMCLFGYFLGSINSAIILSRIYPFPDPRTHGSNNPGATNVYRLAGGVPAIMVLVFDILKGAIPVYLAYLIGVTPIAIGFVGIAACLGHIYPFYFDFGGGKAVATAFGVLLPVGFKLAGLLILTWVVVLLLFRYSSLAAIVTVSLAPVYTYYIKPEYTVPVAMIAVLVVFRHSPNIKRLLKGSEPKVALKKSN